jgi:hypothetical protein
MQSSAASPETCESSATPSAAARFDAIPPTKSAAP